MVGANSDHCVIDHLYNKERMISAIKRNRVMITISLLLLLVVTGITALVVSGVINESLLKNNKETVSFLLECVKLLIIITGGVVAYLRFFQGHLFMAKLDFSINHKLILITPTHKIHFLDIVINNIGDYSIYNPVVKVITSYLPEIISSGTEILKDGQGRINERGRKVNDVLRARTPTSLLYQL